MNIPALPSHGASLLVGRLGVGTQNKKTLRFDESKIAICLKI